MRAQLFRLPSGSRIAQLAITLGFIWIIVFGAHGSTTIDFDWLFPIPPGTVPADWQLPWDEDGFTVASESGPNARLLKNLVLRDAAPPYPGSLVIYGSGLTVNSVRITEDSGSPFDLFSLDLVKLGIDVSSTTNFAAVVSSAGGMYNLRGVPNETTLTFSGSQWQNLSFVRVLFLSDGSGLFRDGVMLDNFVVQVSVVPEPSSLCLGSLAAGGLWWSKRKLRRRS